MERKIIYKNDAGGVSIITPTPEVLSLYGIEAVAVKDVPAGKPYKIVSALDLPTDRTFRDAWEVSESDLTDGVGGDSNSFAELG